MSTRYNENWLTSYLKMTSATEPASRFHLWTAITIIAAMLGRKCEIEFGPTILHPNLYTVFVGPPGIRKSEAIKYGEELLQPLRDQGIKGLATAPDIVTRQEFYQQIVDAEFTDYFPSGEPFVHSSLFVIAPELVIFLNEKDIVQRLGDLCAFYDGKAKFHYKPKQAAAAYAIKPSVWILGATTPNWIQISMPQLAVGGGMTSRTIFVVATSKGKHISYTDMPKFDEELRNSLICDLAEIKKLIGKFTFDPQAVNYYREWYHKAYPNHGIKDQRLLSYVERLPSMMVKVAMVISAAQRDDMIVTQKDLRLSIKFFSDLHQLMPLAFGGQGLSNIGAQTNIVKEMIRDRTIISEAELLATLDMHISKFDLVRIMETLLTSRYCRCDVLQGEKCYIYAQKPITDGAEADETTS